MKNSAMLTSVNVDTAMYFARVITFDIAVDGIGMSIFKANQIKKRSWLTILFTYFRQKRLLVNGQSFCI